MQARTLLFNSVCTLSHSADPSGELDANRPVPFRLTPGLQAFVSPIGLTGPLQMDMIAATRALVQPQHSLVSILRAILRDEFISWKKVSGRWRCVCVCVRATGQVLIVL